MINEWLLVLPAPLGDEAVRGEEIRVVGYYLEHATS